MNYWWVSFAVEGKNLGIVIAKGNSIEEVVAACTALGCNPGGEALGMRIDLSILPAKVKSWVRSVELFKLLQFKDIPEFLQPKKLSTLEADGYDVEGRAEFICKDCNQKLEVSKPHHH
jgi:hypothetical protein